MKGKEVLMNALILDGGRHGATPTAAVHAALAAVLAQRGWQTTTIDLGAQKIAYCLGCFECWTKTPGLCRIDDDGRQVTAAMLAGDLVVYLTPVTFGGYSSVLKKAVDRSICLVSPFFSRIDGEVHHRARYEQYPSLLAVGVLPAPDPSQQQMFGRLIERNALNLHAPTCGSCVVYADQAADVQRAALATALESMAAPIVASTHTVSLQMLEVA
jgi:multimeric flavodoxin WrbA